jgi:hypothetical protein
MIGALITPKFHCTGGVSVWNDQNMGWGQSASYCIDCIDDDEICLAIQHHVTFRGAHILQVVTPRGIVGWIQFCNIKQIYLVQHSVVL